MTETPHSPRVLLLGDPSARPDGLERSLVRAGFHVSEADNATTAGSGPSAPDLVVISVPRADRLLEDALATLDGPAWTTVPRLVLLSASEPDDATKALLLGADDALLAPIHLPELNARLAARLRRRSADSSTQRTMWRQEVMFTILEELAIASRSDQIVETLVRRVGTALEVARCSFILAGSDDRYGRVVAVCENPATRDLRVDLRRYPEVREALRSEKTVFIPDLERHPLFTEVDDLWEQQGFTADVKSVVVIPLHLRGRAAGVFLLRTARSQPDLTPDQVDFAEQLLRATERLLENEERRAGVARRQASALATDLLTGCGNLDALDRRLQEEFERGRRYALTFSMVLLDVDQLRGLNERLGTVVGDRILSELGALLLREVRAPDFVSRYGGDEFALVLPETDLDGAREAVGRIRKRVAEHPFPDLPQADRPTFSAGIVTVPHPSAGRTSDLFALAEAALLRGKAQTDGRIGTAETVAA